MEIERRDIRIMYGGRILICAKTGVDTCAIALDLIIVTGMGSSHLSQTNGSASRCRFHAAGYLFTMDPAPGE